MPRMLSIGARMAACVLGVIGGSVALVMAVAVVDLLEVVQIDEHQRKRAFVAPGVTELKVQHLLANPAGVGAGQLVVR